MAIRRIEVPLFGGESFDGLLDAAHCLADQCEAQIEARYIRPSAGDAALYDAGFGFASASLIEQLDKEGVAAAAEARRRFDRWVARQSSAPRIVWHAEEGQAGAVVARHGCLADLVLLQRAGRSGSAIDEPFEAAVFGAGRLAMVVDAVLSPNFLDHAVIAWNDSSEASRAVALSMPFLTKARRVSIVPANETGAEPADVQALIDYLALHDVSATAIAVPPITDPIGPWLMNAAMKGGATLLIKGAYTHGRVRQLLFGGATQYFLTTPGLPVLFAH